MSLKEVKCAVHTGGPQDTPRRCSSPLGLLLGPILTEEAATSQMTMQVPLARSSNFRRVLVRSEKSVWGSFLLILAVSPGLCR